MISVIAAHVFMRTRRDEGQDLLEYALLCALIVVAALGAVSSLGDVIKTVFWDFIAGAASDI